MRRRSFILLAALALPALATAPASAARPLKKAGWLGGVAVTEYYPAPEAWFVGRKVAVPGLATKHRIDWLYSATGVSMEGEGVGLDGRTYHIDALGAGGWVDARGRTTAIGSKRPIVWRAGAYWLTHTHALTFPLAGGGWSAGVGKRYVPLPDVTFAVGPSKPLRFYRSIAVDPRLIPLGSRVYIAAYRGTVGGGWFRAQDVGGAILGRHVDVYRSPPASPDLGANSLTGQRIYVIPPGARAGRDAPRARQPAPPPSTPSDAGGAGQPGAPSGSGAAGGAGAP